MKMLVALSLVLFAASAPAQQFGEEITVERLIVDAHVIDDKGNPILELRPTDFDVRVDGKKAEVESVEAVPVTEIPIFTDSNGEPEIIHRGRLIVIFFQTDFQRDRVKGQMRMTTHAQEFIDRLLPGDRVAVVSYDSRLKLRQDFTDEPSKLKFAIREALNIDDPGEAQLVPSPALKTYLSADAARNAATPERGLYVLARALEQIPGPKSLLLFGWGLGRYTPQGVVMTHEYAKAREALDSARTTVFSLDVSDADYHSLEAGLKKASKDTGGLYMKTHQFARFAMSKVERTIEHRYELTVKTPPITRGTHRVEVKLRKKRGTVLARTTFVAD
jgi:VWFA-related protein